MLFMQREKLFKCLVSHKYNVFNVQHIIYDHSYSCLCFPEIHTVSTIFVKSTMLIVVYVCRQQFHIENIENIYCHSLSVQYNTIQCYLSTECIQNQFLYLKDCTSKHVGPIVSYKGFEGILTLKTILNTNIDSILSYCW